MVALNWPKNAMNSLLAKLKKQYAHLNFVEGKEFCWSPKTQTITYRDGPDDETMASWSLLHELAHALLGHSRYNSDFELLHMEAAAWHKAAKIAALYSYTISGDHIQDCLDTYRDWLHQRSTCPVCGTTSLQESARKYSCHNCRTAWTVTSSRFCRPYRRWQQIEKSPTTVSQATFS